MKKNYFLLSVAVILPIILCSCFNFNKEVKSIKLNETNVQMTVGDTFELEASVSPEEADYKSLDWSSSDENIVTVSDGTLKAKGAGTAVVTVKSENKVKKTCNVTVSAKEISSIILSSNNVSVKAGKKIQLTAKVQPSDAPSDGLKWTSSDEEIAVVNSDGFVTGVKAGVVNITCMAPNGKEAVCTVTVKSSSTSSSSSKSSSSSQQSSSNNNQSYYNYTPRSNGSITTVTATPQQIGNAYKSDFVFYDSSYRYITNSEASYLSSSQAQTAINEIYARHGRAFKDSGVRSYFYSKAWYVVNPSYSDSDLNSIETSNINLLTKYR